MIPATDEDRLKSRIYYRVGLDWVGDYSDYIRECRKKFEEEKYLSKPLDRVTSLEDELLSLAYSYHNTPKDKQRRIDLRALKTIKKHNKCSGNDPIVVHYFRIYNDIKKTLPDFLAGNYYIDNKEEDGSSVGTVPKDKRSRSLIDSLFDLAEEYEMASVDKKRDIDRKALQTIRRCKGCRKSLSITRSYYKIYYQMTGRGIKETAEKSGEPKESTGS